MYKPVQIYWTLKNTNTYVIETGTVWSNIFHSEQEINI